MRCRSSRLGTPSTSGPRPPLLTFSHLLGVGSTRALDTDDVLALYYDNDANLKAVFDRYCKVGDRAGEPAALGALLNITEFGMVLREAGLMGGNDKVSHKPFE